MKHGTKQVNLIGRFLVILIAVLLCTPGENMGQSRCTCLKPNDSEYIPGVVWKSEKPDITLHEIVSMLAPVLWFSSDEPLIAMDQVPIPHPHPCDVDNGNAVVYYQIHRIRLRKFDKLGGAIEESSEAFEKIEALAIRYYFYYKEDIGMSPHAHDLEVTEFEVFLEITDSGCYQIRVGSVIGFAHGVDWYYNELDIEDDVKFPVTLLIEEGKHASCPDRNADGYYTPGYDVNKRINDAWGVRDVLRTGFLMGSQYKSSMTKPRKPEYRMLPPANNLSCVSSQYSSLNEEDGFMGRYELRDGRTVTVCDDIPPERNRLLRMMKDHEFGSEYEPEQYHFEELRQLSDPLSYTGILTGISARYDRHFGIAAVFRGLDLGEGYVVPRITYVRDHIGIEAMFTSSAAQFFSSYLAAGAQYEYIKNEPDKWDFVSELGIKFRARLPPKARWFTLGYHFAGLRLGIRNKGFKDIEELRFIVEIGAGLF